MTYQKQFNKIVQLTFILLLIFSFKAHSKGYFPTNDSAPIVKKTVKVKKKRGFRFFKKIKKIKKILSKKAPLKNKIQYLEGAIISLIFCLAFLIMGYILSNGILFIGSAVLLTTFLIFVSKAKDNNEKNARLFANTVLSVIAGILITIFYLIPTNFNLF